jgi:hypothetical protein
MMRQIRRRLARPLRAKAKTAQGQGRWGDALRDYARVRRLIGDSPPLLLQIANMQTELESFEEARTTFEAVAKDPEFTLRGLVGLAGLAERRKDWAAAVEAWEGVLAHMAAHEAAPQRAAWPFGPATAILHSALSREMLGDGSGAERDLALAMIVDPAVRHSREAILMRSRILQRGRPADAYRLLVEGHRRHPDDRSILHFLVSMGLANGHRDTATAHARKLLAIAPRDPGLLALMNTHRLDLDMEPAN